MKTEQKTNTIDFTAMTSKQLLKYYEGLKSTNAHLKKLYDTGELVNLYYADWKKALQDRADILDEVRYEMVRRMDNGR
jgi:hypothetical protein